ncbi:MAG: stage III sporulation protein AG [Lachnospiraceae bacterium]|nr:stage III sporulation protein AG [Lachnospiraceae bacterium]
MKKDRFSLDKLKKIPKNQLLIGGLAGILLLVIAIPVEKKADSGGEPEQEWEAGQTSEEDTGDYARRMELKLRKILGNIEGVGQVEVMITLKDDGQQLVEKDRGRSSQDIQEQDGTTTRTDTQQQSQEETVYFDGNESGGTPFVAKEIVPEVEGVLVVAEGGGNSQVAKNISDAVLALFPVEVHKIKVVKMN